MSNFFSFILNLLHMFYYLRMRAYTHMHTHTRKYIQQYMSNNIIRTLGLKTSLLRLVNSSDNDVVMRGFSILLHKIRILSKKRVVFVSSG